MCLKGEGSYQIDCDRKGEWVGQPGVRTSWMSKPWKQKAQATKLLRFMFCVSQLRTCPWQSQSEPWPWRVSCLPDRLSSEHSEHVASSYFSLFWLTCPGFKQSFPYCTFITLQDFHRWYGSWICIYFGPVLALPGPSSTHCTGMCLLYSVSCLIVVWGLMLFSSPLRLDNSQFLNGQFAAVAFDCIFSNQTWYHALNTMFLFIYKKYMK